MYITVLNLSKLTKITGTESEPYRILWKCSATLTTFYIVWIPVRCRVTQRFASPQTIYNVLTIAKHGEITTKFQFIGTGTEPENNRTLRQFNNVQYCTRYYGDQGISLKTKFA